MPTRDRDYYRRRVEQEKSAAESATCERVRQAHLDLAELHSTKLDLLDALASGPFPRLVPEPPEPVIVIPASPVCGAERR